MNVRESTLRTIVKRFNDNGFSLTIKHNWRPRPKIPPAVASELIKDETLKRWGHLSTLERCRQIRFDYNINISDTTLRTFYKMHGIHYLKASFQRTSKIESGRDKFEKVWRYASELVVALRAGKNPFYIDQTTFNMWSQKKSTWQHPDSKLHFFQ